MDTSASAPIQIGTTHIHYFPTKIIDRGTSSVVYEGFFGKLVIKAAIKEVNKNHVDVYDREMTVFENIKADPFTCTNVVVLHGWFEDSTNYYLAMEKADYTLRQFLTKYPALERSVKIQVIQNIANGLDYLHDKNIVHRDIKPENILLFGNDRNVIAKLGDFGVSRKMSNAINTISRGRGTEEWMSPEAIIAKLKDGLLQTSKSIDIYPLGMTAYFTLSNGQHPFHKSRDHGANETMNIKDPDVPPIKLIEPTKCYSTTHLLSWMMRKTAEDRPNIKQVTSHPMFWKPAYCLLFIYQIARTLNDTDNDESKIIRGNIDQAYRELYRKLYNKGLDCVSRVDSRLFVSSDGKRTKYCKDSIMSLVELIRDKNEHFKVRLPDLVRDLFEDEFGGYSEEKYVKYYLDLFPDIVIFLFCAFMDQTASYFATLNGKFYKEYDASLDFALFSGLIKN